MSDKSKKSLITEKKEVLRKSDTLKFRIPNIEYYDTIIERVNYSTRHIAKIHYDSEGNQSFESQCPDIIEITELTTEITENDIEFKKKVENELTPQKLFYAIAGLGVVLIIFMILLLIIFSKAKGQSIQLIKDLTELNK